MNIYHVTDEKFRKYGSIVKGYDFSELLEVMKSIPIPTEPDRVDYVAAEPKLEALPIFAEFRDGFFGGMPVELGYCMGHNQMLNGLEYHRDSEVNVSATDYIVLVGTKQDLTEDFRYDTALVEAFYVPAGLAVEFFATTLHYCACHVQEEGYAHATFLPRGTNCPLEDSFRPRTDEDLLMTAKNKWMLVHAEGGFDEAIPVKLDGENLSIDRSDWEKARGL